MSQARGDGRADAKGDVIILAGGTGGFARAPRAFAQAGRRFVLVGRSDGHARSAEEAFARAGIPAAGVALDLLRDGEIDRAFALARERFAADAAALVWNVGFAPWPAKPVWDPSVVAKTARDEARAWTSLADAIVKRYGAPRPEAERALHLVTVEGNAQARTALGAPAVRVADGVRAALIERLQEEIPGLARSRVRLGAIPSGPTGEGRWLSAEEIADGVTRALDTRLPEVSMGDLELAARLAARFA